MEGMVAVSGDFITPGHLDFQPQFAHQSPGFETANPIAFIFEMFGHSSGTHSCS